MTWLIDLTDQRFKIPVNADIIDYIQRANPFAHSDLGQKLIDLGRELPATSAYSPNFKICAYVLLHNAANAIFAFASDTRDLSFRLPRRCMTKLWPWATESLRESAKSGSTSLFSSRAGRWRVAKSDSGITAVRPSAMLHCLFPAPDAPLRTNIAAISPDGGRHRPDRECRKIRLWLQWGRRRRYPHRSDMTR